MVFLSKASSAFLDTSWIFLLPQAVSLVSLSYDLFPPAILFKDHLQTFWQKSTHFTDKEHEAR